MSIRMRRQATDRLPLSRGDSLLVKRFLTAGETRDMLRAAMKPIPVTPGAATIELDPIAASEALVLAYLLDWTFADADGRPLVIADQPPAAVRAVLAAIDGDAYLEVQRAIQDHQAATAAALAAEKKTASGAATPDRILASVE